MPSFLTSIAGSGSGQYFADQYGQPYMVRWDTVWCLIVNAGNSGGATTYQSDMAGYCSLRSSLGFNGFITTPVADASHAGGPFENGNTWDGVAPFSSPGVLNNTFWTRVDYLLAQAETCGMTVIMNVMFTYAINDGTGCLNGWTNTQYQNYGAAVGARYASQPNVTWELGDDYGGSWDGGLNGYDTKFSAFLTGLRGAGANQPVSVENMSECDSRYSDDGSTTFAWGGSNAQFNWCYSYNASYLDVENAYSEVAGHSVPYLTACKMDGVYDNQYGTATLTESEALYWRKWIWWVLSAGSRGAMYGAYPQFTWPTGALAGSLFGASPGSSYVAPSVLNDAWNIFASLAGWHKLISDTSSALVTAGRGTRVSAIGAGAGTFAAGDMYTGGNTWVTASVTADGSLAVAYLPAASSAITVSPSPLKAGYQVTWVDPLTGTATPQAISSTYSNAGNNSAGGNDWLLVFQQPSQAGGAAAPFTAPMRRT